MHGSAEPRGGSRAAIGLLLALAFVLALGSSAAIGSAILPFVTLWLVDALLFVALAFETASMAVLSAIPWRYRAANWLKPVIVLVSGLVKGEPSGTWMATSRPRA